MTENAKIGNLREEIISTLIKAGIPSPRLETDIILKHAAPSYPEVNKAESAKAYEMLKRRINHEPLDKIIGEREFYKSVFKVNQNVLTPRPDTEILVEEAINLLKNKSEGTVLDLGTGSGCILLSILKEYPKLRGIGVDISKKALDVAKENAERLGVATRCTFKNCSWTQLKDLDNSTDMIVTNPPYIESDEIANLEEEVKTYDPKIALDGGKDGYQCYREIAKLAPSMLKKEGYILIEAGIGQAEKIGEIFENEGLVLQKIVQDLGGINRCVILKK